MIFVHALHAPEAMHGCEEKFDESNMSLHRCATFDSAQV